MTRIELETVCGFWLIMKKKRTAGSWANIQG